MSVTIHVPSVLRRYTGEAATLERPDAATVGASLDALARTHPDLYRAICDETGTVRRHVNVFVNNTSIRDADSLATRISPGDVLTIMPAVSGG
jgi:molybdopterin converting factor small subunit